MVKDLGIYVHIPFCLQKCGYCDFVSFCSTDEQREEYVSALITEIEKLSPFAKERTISTVYIGGGTPTTLSNSQLSRILNSLHENFDIKEDAEITVEANPETVTLKLMRSLKDAGVNRISLGVQAMQDKHLKAIGRIHDVKKVIEAYASCKIAGFNNINYDLIFALPNQSKNEFLDGLCDLLKLEPPHLSLYSLQLEEGTPLYADKNNLKFVSEDEERNIYYEAREILKASGLYQYEISNFAKQGFESRHNLRYWNCSEYLGIGLNASSYFNNVRYTNPCDLTEYLNFVQNFKPLYKENDALTENEQMSEILVLGLRKTDGIKLKDFEQKFKKDIFSVFKKQINKHIESGLISLSEDKLYLTEKGIDLSNQVLCDFI